VIEVIVVGFFFFFFSCNFLCQSKSRMYYADIFWNLKRKTLVKAKQDFILYILLRLIFETKYTASSLLHRPPSQKEKEGRRARTVTYKTFFLR